jgi:hypothetical protein
MLLMPLGIVAPETPKAQSKRRIHLKDVYIAGTQYHNVSTNHELARLAVGDALRLKREPDNKYDESAIAVYTQANDMVGYIPRYQNRTIARIMDQGVVVTATIDKIAPDDAPWRRIWITVQEEI